MALGQFSAYRGFAVSNSLRIASSVANNLRGDSKKIKRRLDKSKRFLGAARVVLDFAGKNPSK